MNFEWRKKKKKKKGEEKKNNNNYLKNIHDCAKYENDT